MLEEWSSPIAAYAAVVSTGLLAVRIWEARQGRARFRVSTKFHPSTGDQPSVVTLTVRNIGTGTATVGRLDLDVPGPARISLTGDDLLIKGPEMPIRLEGRSAETWQIDAEKLKALLRQNGWSYRVRGIVTLQDRGQVWESIHQYTTVH